MVVQNCPPSYFVVGLESWLQNATDKDARAQVETVLPWLHAAVSEVLLSS